MITIRTLYFFLALAVFLAVLLGVAGYAYLRARRRHKYPYGRWESLVKRLAAVDRDRIALIALDFIDEAGQRRRENHAAGLDPEQISTLIGGMEGLALLERNCKVLVDLVFYVQQWYPEALVITEQLRQNAREVEWHVSRLKVAARNGRLESLFPDYGQRAVAVYYLMTRQVLALYEQAQLPGFAELQQAL